MHMRYVQNGTKAYFTLRLSNEKDQKVIGGKLHAQGIALLY